MRPKKVGGNVDTDCYMEKEENATSVSRGLISLSQSLVLEISYVSLVYACLRGVLYPRGNDSQVKMGVVFCAENTA